MKSPTQPNSTNQPTTQPNPPLRSSLTYVIIILIILKCQWYTPWHPLTGDFRSRKTVFDVSSCGILCLARWGYDGDFDLPLSSNENLCMPVSQLRLLHTRNHPPKLPLIEIIVILDFTSRLIDRISRPQWNMRGAM